jgi:hypothetical protein
MPVGRRIAWRHAAVCALSGLAMGSAHAQSSQPFAAWAGAWSGGGSITTSDGSTERLRCRATYAVGAGGTRLQQSLLCASDSYRFQLASNVTANGRALSGTWSEATRGISGHLGGSLNGGRFEVLASSPNFNANLRLTTSGNHQTVSITSDSQIRSVAISLARN